MRYKDDSKITDLKEYQLIYKDSIENNDAFWSKQAERINWYEKWKKVSNNNYNEAQIKWFEGGKLNASYNCIDRHVENGNGNKIAIIWEGNDSNDEKRFTYYNSRKIRVKKDQK